MPVKFRLLTGLALVAFLAACAPKQAPSEAGAPAVDDEEAELESTMPPPPPPAPQVTPSMANTLLGYVKETPECQSFRAQLEDAAKTPEGQPLGVDLGKLMDEVAVAGCKVEK